MSDSVLVRLLRAYKEEGYEISVGLNPLRESPNGHFAYLVKSSLIQSLSGFPDTDYSAYEMYLKKENEVEKKSSEKKSIIKKIVNKIKHSLTKEKMILPVQPAKVPYFCTGGGISLEEIYFFETLLKAFEPKREFLIGIASGWSTIAFGLITPTAELYGMDNCIEGTAASEGLILTEKIAKKININLKIHKGSSPKDVPCILNHVKGTIDFAFIDGLHTNEQVFQDFMGILPYMSESSIIAFHDVLNWNLIEGWGKIVDVALKNNYKAVILRRTTSGIGILYRDINKTVEDCIEAFYQNPSLLCPT